MTDLGPLAPVLPAGPVGFGPRSPVAVSLLGKAAEAITLVALVILLPRVLGPVDYGRFAVVLSIVTLVSTSLALGSAALLSRFLPALAPAERLPAARALALRLGRFRLLQVLLVVAASGALAVTAPDRFPTIQMLLLATAVVFDSAATLGYQIMLGLGRPGLWSFRYPMQNAVLCGAVVALHAAAGVTGAIAGIVVGAGLAALVAAIAVGRELRGVRPALSLPEGALRFGIVQSIGSFFVQFVHRGTVIAVVLLAGSSTEAGFAALASGVALALTYVVAQAFLVELPRLSARFETSPSEAERSVRRLAWLSLAVTLPVALGGELLVEHALPHVVGTGFDVAAPAFGPAFAMLPLAGLTSAASQISALRLRSGARLLANAVGATAFLVTAVLAVPVWGSVGATAALLVATISTVAAAARLLPGVYSRSLVVTAIGGTVAVVALAALSEHG